MVDDDTIQKVSRLFGVPMRSYGPYDEKRQIVNVCALHGDPAINLMRRLRPYMFSRRRTQIDVALNAAKSRPGLKFRGRRKLTIKLANKMRAEYAKGQITVYELATRYGLSYRATTNCLNFRSWKI
jgi:hypothetical protein